MESDVTVSEWGNSLAVRIPKNIAAEIGVKKGTHLRIKTDGESLHLSKSRKKSRYTIEELMANTTPEEYRNALSPEDWKFFQTDVGCKIIED